MVAVTRTASPWDWMTPCAWLVSVKEVRLARLEVLRLVARLAEAVASISPSLVMEIVPAPGRIASSPLAPIKAPVWLVMLMTAVDEVMAAKSSACPLACATMEVLDASSAPETMIPELSTVIVPLEILVLMRKASLPDVPGSPRLTLTGVTDCGWSRAVSRLYDTAMTPEDAVMVRWKPSGLVAVTAPAMTWAGVRAPKCG